MSLIKNNEELDSTLLIIGALVAWLLHAAALVFVESFAASPAAEHMGRFIDSIVLMVFTYKFTKSRPSARSGGNDKSTTDAGTTNS